MFPHQHEANVKFNDGTQRLSYQAMTVRPFQNEIKGTRSSDISFPSPLVLYI